MSGSPHAEKVWEVLPEWFVREHEPLVRRRSHASVMKLWRLMPPEFLAGNEQLLLRLREEACSYECLRWQLAQCSSESSTDRMLAVAVVLRTALTSLSLSETRSLVAIQVATWRSRHRQPIRGAR